MRELKFRAFANGVMWKHAMPTLDTYKVNVSQHENGTWNVYLSRDDCQVMQYTGLKDRNGKEIYEGDVVKYYGLMCLVFYDEGLFLLRNKSISDVNLPIWKECDVVGNIYEHSELL